MAQKTLYMGTTKIDPMKNAGEIMKALQESGAQQIVTEFDTQRDVTGMRFTLVVGSVIWAFSLPVRWEPLLRRVGNDKARAKRVAWRQLLRWVQAQLALIETGMVRPEEVYAPYRLLPDGRTLGQALLSAPLAQSLMMLEGGK